jgi:glycerol-3-phosphate dehydrogenase (NAD(P)+)
MTRRPEIAIFGAGAWGTALAMAWGRQGTQVVLWGHPPGMVKAMAESRQHARLPGAELPPTVHPVAQPEEAFGAPIWVSALPTQLTPQVWKDLAGSTRKRPELAIHASKGILRHTHQRISQALEPLLGVPVGALSGPTFADEVAMDRPAALVMALPPAVENERAREIQALLATPSLRIYLSRDLAGVELCGALKNILAIAAGLVEALDLGNNARAALLTRGLAEMARLVERLGGRPETVMGLAGMGDLLLTATGAQSRNRRFGVLLGQGVHPLQATAAMGEQVVEGAFTAEAALGLARTLGIEMPITEEVTRLLRGANLKESVQRLMNRSLKSED